MFRVFMGLSKLSIPYSLLTLPKQALEELSTQGVQPSHIYTIASSSTIQPVKVVGELFIMNISILIFQSLTVPSVITQLHSVQLWELRKPIMIYKSSGALSPTTEVVGAQRQPRLVFNQVVLPALMALPSPLLTATSVITQRLDMQECFTWNIVIYLSMDPSLTVTEQDKMVE